MTAEMEQVQTVMLRYNEMFVARYHEKWMPTNEHIRMTLEAMRSPIPGFPGYTADDLVARLNSFFACKEEWLTSTKHNYAVFLKHIHRWIGKSATARAIVPHGDVQHLARPCDVHPEILVRPGEFCPKCFPKCAKCGRAHAITISCNEQKQLDAFTRRVMSSSEAVGRGNVVTINGETVYRNDEKGVNNA